MANAKTLPLEHSNLPTAYMNIFMVTPKGQNLKIGMVTLDPNDEYKQLNDQVQTVKNVRALISKCESEKLYGVFRQSGNMAYVINRAGGNDNDEVSADDIVL